MQKKEIDKAFEAFNNYMSANKIKDAIGILEQTGIETAEFSDELCRINDTYRSLVKYTFLGVEDSQRLKIYLNLKQNLYELSDRIKHKLLERGRLQNFAQYKEANWQAQQMHEQIKDLFETYSFDTEVEEMLSNTEVEPEKSIQGKKNQKTQLLSLLFEWLWFGGKLTGNDKEIVKEILNSERFYWYEKCLIISALTMGLIKGFDALRVELLFDCYDINEYQISQRAFTGLLLGFYYYDERLYLYPQLLNRLKAMQGDEILERDAIAVIFQLMKAKDTEKVTKKFREEILPDLARYAPKLEDKLGLSQIISDDPSEDKNPNWKKIFEESPDLINKLEEITRMQLEGMDVFMSTFANLKHFPFFAELANWFVPFHTGHQLVKDMLANEEPHFKEIFIDGLNRSQHMCNSDKYSFCNSIGIIPHHQKEMMIQMFAAEVEGMKELEKEEDILDARKKINSIYTQYIQDIYRFFKLYPRRQELDDLFRLRFDFHNKKFMQHIITSDTSWRIFADFYFDKEYYGEALEIFLKINDNGDNSQEIFEKIAYCFEKQNHLEKALVYYHKAELFNQNRAWNLRKIARVQWMLKNYDQSIKSYKEAEILDPENLHLQITIGNCYLHIKDYKQALNYYYKVELASPDNQKVMRPIAWCLFVSGKIAEARHYYEKLLEYEPNKYDFMNLGHVFLCMNKRQQAVDCYLLSLKHKNNSMKQFMSGFDDDRFYLLNNGIDPEELPLIVDYIKYMYEQTIE